MTYKEFIDGIIKTRGRHGCGKIYHEKHHIKPRCMGGEDKEENYIDLYAKEHFIAHKLLAEENPHHQGLQHAWWMMAHVVKDGGKRYRCTPEEYEEAKIAFSNAQMGEKNPMYHKKHTEETRKIMSEKKKDMYDGENNPHWENIILKNSSKKLSQSRIGGDNPKAKKVYCKELDMTFNTIKEAQEYVGIKSGILQCCHPKYKRETAGKHPQTHEKLHWCFVNE